MEKEFGITDKQFEDAEKRHEDKYQEELENVDIRAVVLKTKKSLLEQARVNARCEKAAIDQQYQIKDLNNKVQNYIMRLEAIERTLASQTKVFTDTVALLHKEDKKEGFFSRLFKWMK